MIQWFLFNRIHRYRAGIAIGYRIQNPFPVGSCVAYSSFSFTYQAFMRAKEAFYSVGCDCSPKIFCYPVKHLIA